MLSSFPLDIQYLILPQLNFTDLISVSQVNKSYRHLIDPQRRHFIGRLLELECLPQYCGGTPDTQSSSYACAQCLKLLPHTRFDNHSILRVRFQKPPAGSQQLCGWVPGDAKAQGLKRQADLRLQKLRGDKIGIRRNERKCNQCKFKIGFWARKTTSNSGTALTPVIKGRKKAFHDASERYFPGLFPYSGEYHVKRRVYREVDLTIDKWTMYSVRCPGCAIWQELASFRRGGPLGYKAKPVDPPMWDMSRADWPGPEFEKWRCNHCILKESGEEQLEKLLLQHWETVVGPEITLFNYLIQNAWDSLEELDKPSVWNKNQHLSWKSFQRSPKNTGLKIPNTGKLREIDMEARLELFGAYTQFVRSFKKEEVGEENYWLRGYEAMERRWDFLKKCAEQVEANPKILVEHALKTDACRTL